MKSPQLVPYLMEKQTTFPRDQHYKNMRFPPSPQHLTESASPSKQARKKNRSPTGIGQESLSVWHGFILWTFLRHTHTQTSESCTIQNPHTKSITLTNMSLQQPQKEIKNTRYRPRTSAQGPPTESKPWSQGHRVKPTFLACFLVHMAEQPWAESGRS